MEFQINKTVGEAERLCEVVHDQSMADLKSKVSLFYPKMCIILIGED